MILLLALLVLWMAALTVFSSLLQSLYLESQRLRTRESKALDYFKETLQEAIGSDPDRELLAFSVVKHTLMALQGVVLLTMFLIGTERMGEAVLTASLSTLALMVVTTQLLPQLLYRKTECKWLMAWVPAAKILLILTKPVTALLLFLLSLFDLGTPDTAAQDEPSSAEQMEALIDQSAEEGIIEEEDRKLLQSAASFSEKQVREVMTPRPNMVAIQVDRTLEDLRQLVVKEQYSRVPVYEKSLDEVVGFVHVRDILTLDEDEREGKSVRDVLRPLRVVPETKPVDALLREMQQDGLHMSIVVDEYGNTAGLVTLEDLVEQLVGEIHDEHDPDRDVMTQPDGSYVLAGNFDVDRLEELVGFRANEDTESTTVGGLVTEWLGHVPAAGENVEREGIRIEVLSSSELRVEQVRVRKAA